MAETSQPDGRNETPVTLAEMWTRSRRLLELVDREGSHGLLDRAVGLETAVMIEPIGCLADLIAKLRAAGLVFADGPRSDGADATALEQAIAWLEAR